MSELFETYYKMSKSSDLKKDEKVFLCENIGKLSLDDKEMAFLMIYLYHVEEGGEKTTTLPYKSCQSEDDDAGIEFSLTKLPFKLRQMLYNFTLFIVNKK